ncbi:YjbF family lipoprotein [Celerinatantimonas sp. YJH-8]|uniref:YjbF family lipoprotein n=1 Tax=Celerinatantimonas sp. YJH-8 TaxID=3228714 RepID=UPI0038C5690F
MMKPILHYGLLASIFLLLEGCTSDSHMAYQMFQDALIKAPDATMSDAQLAQIPYSLTYIRLGDEPRAMVVLAKVSGPERVWISSNKESLVTRYGRIIRTEHLQDANISNITFDRHDPLADGLDGLAKANYKASGYVDMMPGYQYGLPFQTHYTVKGTVQQNIANHAKQLIQVDEDYVIPALNYHTVNHYWLDQHGLVWKSVQRPIPTLPPFTLTLLKPFQRDLQ